MHDCTLHESTFEYIKPDEDQMHRMSAVRQAAAAFYVVLDRAVPDSPDKVHIQYKLREAVMWANVVITRHPNGAPRNEV